MKDFNDRLAVAVTKAVGSMACAYIFCAIALVGLPQAIHDTTTNGFHPLPIVQWIAQTFFQLVLLSIIMVGQRVLGDQHDSLHDKVDAVHEHLGIGGN